MSPFLFFIVVIGVLGVVVLFAALLNRFSGLNRPHVSARALEWFQPAQADILVREVAQAINEESPSFAEQVSVRAVNGLRGTVNLTVKVPRQSSNTVKLVVREAVYEFLRGRPRLRVLIDFVIERNVGEQI